MLGVVRETYAARPFACALVNGAASVSPVPVAPAVPTLAMVTCSASDVASTQIVCPTLNGATLVTLMVVSPAAAAAARVVPVTLPDASNPKGRPTGPTLWQSGLAPSCSTVSAFWICANVGDAVGSNCAIRLKTAGVYGAAASTVGEVFAEGSDAGNVYGTFALDGVGSAWLDVAVPPAKPAATSPMTPPMASVRRRRFPRRRPEDTYPGWILDSAEPLMTVFFRCKPTTSRRTHVTGRRRDQPTTRSPKPLGSLTSGN